MCDPVAVLSAQAASLHLAGVAQLDGLHRLLRAAARARDGEWRRGFVTARHRGDRWHLQRVRADAARAANITRTELPGPGRLEIDARWTREMGERWTRPGISQRGKASSGGCGGGAAGGGGNRVSGQRRPCRGRLKRASGSVQRAYLGRTRSAERRTCAVQRAAGRTQMACTQICQVMVGDASRAGRSPPSSQPRRNPRFWRCATAQPQVKVFSQSAPGRGLPYGCTQCIPVYFRK